MPAMAATPSEPGIAPITFTHSQLVQAEAGAQQWWDRYAAEVNAMLHTGGGAGGCTDYVSARRPDIIAAVEKMAALVHILRNENGPVLVNWVAMDWPYDAWTAGVPMGKKPRRDAVIVFQPGAYGASTIGHVAIVDHVNRNGSFTIKEEHAPRLGVITSRHFSARTARAMAKDPRITFVY
jgi:hypothetical protein